MNTIKKTPYPIRIEFELTNYCNASCDFCPRFNIEKFGRMEFCKYQEFIDKIISEEERYQIIRKDTRKALTIVFGGFGEPLLHPEFFNFIAYAKKYGLQTELITNGQYLTIDNCKRINDSGLDQLSISLHTLNAHLNKKITKLADVIPTVKKALDYFDDKNIKIEIWRVSQLDGQNYEKEAPSDYSFLLKKYNKKINVLGPTPAWNRGGQFDSQFYPVVNDSSEIRCNILFYTWSISFNGDMVKCCCDFSSKKDIISKDWNINLADIQNRITEILKNPTDMCLKCRRPKINLF